MLPFQWKMILPHSPLAGCTFFRIHSLKGESNFQITVGFLQLPWLVPVILARSITCRKRQGRLLWVQYYSTDSCPHRWSREKRHHSYSHRKWGISQRLMMKGLMGNGPIHPGPEVLISSCGCDSTLLWGMMRPTPHCGFCPGTYSTSTSTNHELGIVLDSEMEETKGSSSLPVVSGIINASSKRVL